MWFDCLWSWVIIFDLRLVCKSGQYYFVWQIHEWAVLNWFAAITVFEGKFYMCDNGSIAISMHFLALCAAIINLLVLACHCIWNFFGWQSSREDAFFGGTMMSAYARRLIFWLEYW
jgi:hypothetical protein